MKLGETIVAIRKERKMTQEEFAQIFHVTRQTVSNWEKEKNYPDLETLVSISEEFNISLDVMLKGDKHMVKKLNMDIKFSENFKKNVLKVLLVVVIALAISALIWGIAWKNAKDSLEAKFAEGVEANEFYFDEQLGYYKKVVDQDSYYTLPNQSMPDYFEFVLHYYSTVLDYYTVENGENIQIRWWEKEAGEISYDIHYLDEHGNIKRTLSDKQKKELCEGDSAINRIIKEGEKIYDSVYE